MSIDGKWKVVLDTPLGKQNAELDLTSDGDKLTGTATQAGKSTPIEDGSVNGDDATWKVSVTTPFPMTLAFTVSVSGDSMSGNAKAGSFPPAALTGERV